MILCVVIYAGIQGDRINNWPQLFPPGYADNGQWINVLVLFIAFNLQAAFAYLLQKQENKELSQFK